MSEVNNAGLKESLKSLRYSSPLIHTIQNLYGGAEESLSVSELLDSTNNYDTDKFQDETISLIQSIKTKARFDAEVEIDPSEILLIPEMPSINKILKFAFDTVDTLLESRLFWKVFYELTKSAPKSELTVDFSKLLSSNMKNYALNLNLAGKEENDQTSSTSSSSSSVHAFQQPLFGRKRIALPTMEDMKHLREERLRLDAYYKRLTQLSMVNMDGDNFSAGLDYTSGLSRNHNNLQELLRDVEWLTRDRRTEPFYKSTSELLDERYKLAKRQLEKKGITPKDEFGQSNPGNPGQLIKDYSFSQETLNHMSNNEQGKLYIYEIDKILKVPLSNFYIEFSGTM